MTVIDCNVSKQLYSLQKWDAPIFDEYIDTEEFHLGLESLRQILKQAGKKDSLPFVMDEEKYGELFLYSNFLALSEKGRLWFSALL